MFNSLLCVILLCMDNFNIHWNPIIPQLIWNARSYYVFQAPHLSLNGAIEYVFNTINFFLLYIFPCPDNHDDSDITIENIIQMKFRSFS